MTDSTPSLDQPAGSRHASAAHSASVITTSIAEADGTAGALRYRGVDIRDLLDIATFEQVWSLLLTDSLNHPLPSLARPRRAETAALQTAGVNHAAASKAQPWQLAQRALQDCEVRLTTSHRADPNDVREDLANLAASLLATTRQIIAHQSCGFEARDEAQPPPHNATASAQAAPAATAGPASWAHAVAGVISDANVEERARALNAYWIAAAEHGLNASTTTARVVASAGASPQAAMIAALSAISGPLHGGAPREVDAMLREATRLGDPARAVAQRLASGQRLMGFGHRVYRDDDPRAAVLRKLAQELDIPGLDAALRYENEALRQLAVRRNGRTLATNLEFWAAVLLNFVGVQPQTYSLVFACARAAGWSAHILEHVTSGRPIRPVGRYTGPAPRALSSVAGAADVLEG